MNRIPRGEISQAKDLIYPEKKSQNKVWHQKNLKSLREQEEKNRQLKTEKENYIPPEPYKMKEFKNVQSKLYDQTKEWVNNEKELNKKEKNEKNKPNYRIKKPQSQQRRINVGGDNIYNFANENESQSMFDKYYQAKMRQRSQSPPPMKQNSLTAENQPISLESLQKEIQNDDEKMNELLKEYNENQKRLEALQKEIDEDKKNSKSPPKSQHRQRKPNVPKAGEGPLILPRIQRNYLKENKKIISEHKVQSKAKPKAKEEPAIHKNYGKTPEYLEKYKKEAEIKKEMIQKMKEEAKYPQGTKLLSEEERVSTLNGLIATKKDLTNLLEKMPITTRTMAIQNKKDELLQKIDEIDKAIEMFSKKQVFVKVQ